jgi:two-component system LytT family response regulator
MKTTRKYTILIADDETPARKLIFNFLKDQSHIEIVAEASDGFEAVKKINELQPDIVLLDIKMPKLNGFEVLELIDKQVEIIFTTAYDEFAIQAFEKNAVDYLLKPFSSERLSIALQKAISKNAAQEKSSEEKDEMAQLNSFINGPLHRIAVKQNDKIIIIPVLDVTHIQAQDDFIMIYTPNAHYLKYDRLKNIEMQLDNEIFIKIHRSFIVNIHFIEKIELMEKDSYNVFLKNKTTIKASKSGYSLLKQKLNI